MTTAQQHYDELLASIYVWMAGGLPSALASGAQDVAALVPGNGLAVDLGAGFGMHAIPLARGGYDVVAAASFHGNLSRPEGSETKPIRAKIAVFHGAADKFVAPEQLPAVTEEMTQAGADWYLVSFGGAVHSFTVKEAGDDPSTGMAYNENADRRSWEMLKSLLAESFK